MSSVTPTSALAAHLQLASLNSKRKPTGPVIVHPGSMENPTAKRTKPMMAFSNEFDQAPPLPPSRALREIGVIANFSTSESRMQEPRVSTSIFTGKTMILGATGFSSFGFDNVQPAPFVTYTRKQAPVFAEPSFAPASFSKRSESSYPDISPPSMPADAHISADLLLALEEDFGDTQSPTFSDQNHSRSATPTESDDDIALLTLASGDMDDAERDAEGHYAPPTQTLSMLREREAQYLPASTYMDVQEHITPKMRTILLDWLVEVCEELVLRRETFHLCLNFIDRFLSVVGCVSKSKLQLVGVAALFIAAKLEEIHPPKPDEFVQVTDNSYTLDQLHRMEKFMLRKLNWRLCPITFNSWIQIYINNDRKATLGKRLCKECSISQRECLHGFDIGLFDKIMQIVDLVMLDVNILFFAPSVLVASLYYLYRPGRVGDPITAVPRAVPTLSSASLVAITGYRPKDLQNCISWLKSYTDVSTRQHSTFEANCKNIPLNERHMVQVHYPDAVQLVERLQTTRPVLL